MPAQAVNGFFDSATETLDRRGLRDLQLRRAQALFDEILPRNLFYARKFGADRRVRSWDEFLRLPFTSKSEFADDQSANPPYGTDLTYPVERYVKLHQTSGTTGTLPIRVLDTPESWAWWARCWGYVYRRRG